LEFILDHLGEYAAENANLAEELAKLKKTLDGLDTDQLGEISKMLPRIVALENFNKEQKKINDMVAEN